MDSSRFMAWMGEKLRYVGTGLWWQRGDGFVGLGGGDFYKLNDVRLLRVVDVFSFVSFRSGLRGCVTGFGFGCGVLDVRGTYV